MYTRRILLLILSLWACAQAQLRVQFKEESFTDLQTIHARVLPINGTSTAQTGLRAEFWLRAPVGRTPQAALWDGGNVTLAMVNVGSGLWKLNVTFNGTLAAGQAFNFGNGAQIGIHLDDYSNWTKSTCPSWIAASTYTNDPAIPLYSSSGALLWGTPPGAVKYDTVTVTTGAHGSASPSGSVVVKDGDSLVVAFTPEQTYQIAAVLVDGVSKGTPASWKFTNITTNHTVAVSFVHNDTITITAGAHGSASPSGITVLKDGDSLVIAFLPDPGYRVQSVVVDGVAKGNPSSWKFTNLSSKHSVSVTFESIPSILRAQFRDETPSDAQWIRARVLLVNGTASAKTDLRAEFWMRAPVGRTPQASLWDGSNIDLQMIPVGAGIWKLSMLFRGTLGPGQSFNSGNGASVGIRLDDFSNWIKSNSPSWINTSTWVDDPSIPVYDNSNNLLWGAPPITTKTDTITISSGPNGTTTPVGPVYTKEGDSLNVVFTPDSGYRVLNVLVDGVSRGRISSWKFTSIAANHVVSASFEAVPVPFRVQFKDDLSSDPKWLHARILPINASSNSIKNVRADFWMKVPAGRAPQVALWDGPGVDFRITQVGAYWKVSLYFQTILVPGQAYNFGNGALVGFHLDDWSTWTKAGSPSWINTSVWMDDPFLPLYDSLGNLLWGSSPVSDSVVPKFDTVTIVAGANGNADPSGTILVREGDPLTVKFIPNAKFKVKSVTVDGAAQGAPSAWSFDAVGGNHVITVDFEPASATQYQVTVDLGPNGKANVTGAVLVPAGNSLNLRFQPDPGYVVSHVRLDGQPVATSTSLDFPSVQSSHSIQVLFGLAPRFTVHLSNGGGGRTDPVGDQLVSLGGTQAVSILPDPGYQISDVVVDGVSKGIVPFVEFDNIQGDHSIVAKFRLLVSTGALLDLKHSEERGTDSMWSKPRIILSNVGTKSFGPYTYNYYLRVEPSQTPLLSNWSMPQAHGKLQSLGGGNWMLSITSNAALAAGTAENWGDGNFFGLQTGVNPPVKWDLLNDWSWDGAGPNRTSSRKIPVYDAQGNLVLGSEPDLRTFANAIVPNVQALYHDEGGDTNYLRPRILIRNLGDVSFSDFKVVFIFQTEGGKVPVRDDWYLEHPSVSMQSVGNQVYRVVWDYTGVVVGPHSDWPGQPGSIMGLHYPDWSAWDRSNDYSHMASPNGNLVVDPRILIYDRYGRLVWGEEPKDTTGPRVPSVVQDPRSVAVNEGATALFQVLVVGDAPISYQWRRNGIDIPGANASEYTVGPVSMVDNQDVFTCNVTNAAGSVVSGGGVLTVRPTGGPPKISSCPDTLILVPQGGSVRASVVPSQPGRTTCEWYRTKDGVSVSDECPLLVTHPGVDRSDDKFRVLLRDGLTHDSVWACSTRAIYEPLSQVSMVLSLSGQVALEQNGSVPRDTTVDMVVRLYEQSSGGTPVYLEQHLIAGKRGVSVRKGRFVLEIGRGRSRNSLAETVLAHRSLFVEVGVGDSSASETFLPRVPLNAVPWELGRTVQGVGEPGTRWSSLPVGSLYVDWKTRRTWRKSARGWKPLDI